MDPSDRHPLPAPQLQPCCHVQHLFAGVTRLSEYGEQYPGKQRGKSMLIALVQDVGIVELCDQNNQFVGRHINMLFVRESVRFALIVCNALIKLAVLVSFNFLSQDQH